MAFPLPPNTHALAVLIFVFIALVLFSLENVSLESSSFLVLTGLAVGFELFPFEFQGKIIEPGDFFHGFGHEALVAVCALMIAGQGIIRTGGLEPVGRFLAKFWMISPSFSLLLTLLAGGFISAFINNVPVVVLFLPIIINVSVRTKMSASSVLMPMGFATSLGGSCTTIGTSTNLLVVSVAAQMGLREFGMFDFLYPALISGAIGIIYLWLIAPKLIKDRKLTISDSSPRIFSAHLAIGKSAFGKTLEQVIKKFNGSMDIIGVERGDNCMMALPELVLQEDDHLIISDTPDKLKEFEKVLKGTLYPVDSNTDPIGDENPLKDDDQQIAEVVVIQGSFLENQTLGGLKIADRYGIMILAIHRIGKTLNNLRDEIGNILLKAGDILLVQGPRDNIKNLKKEKDFLVLDATTDLPYVEKAPIAVIIMFGVILTAALGIMPISLSASCGALLMIATGCLSWRDATNALSVQVVLIVAASLALGIALLKTGGADYLAKVFLYFGGDSSPVFVISGLMLLMAGLTNILSNNAAAVIGTPIAMSLATQMGQPAEPFVLAVLFGANMSYATPMAYKTNLLVMNAGKYSFRDFIIVGLPLVIIMWVTLSFVLPKIYGII